MNAVARFKEIAAQPQFAGWPLVGEYQLAEKVPFFGQVLRYQLQTPKGAEDYVSLLRHFGWAVVFGVTTDRQVITLVQWKPGVNQASWELPPGGIGKVPATIGEEELLLRTRDSYLKETGYGAGRWRKLGRVLIESGKYRGADPNDHGLSAHLFLATGLERFKSARDPEPNEIMSTLLVDLDEFEEVIDSGEFLETSAVACALLALRHLRVTA